MLSGITFRLSKFEFQPENTNDGTISSTDSPCLQHKLDQQLQSPDNTNILQSEINYVKPFLGFSENSAFEKVNATKANLLC